MQIKTENNTTYVFFAKKTFIPRLCFIYNALTLKKNSKYLKPLLYKSNTPHQIKYISSE